MRKAHTLIFTAALVLALASVAGAQDLTRANLEALANAMEFFVVIEPVDDEPLRFMYADMRQHVHVYAVNKGRATLEWEKTDLDTRVSSLFVRDLVKDGTPEIILTTKGGRILAFDINTYEQVFENLVEPFDRITCLTPANIDDDPQDELIFTNGENLFIYDSLTRAEEWKSEAKYTARQIVVANVDDDPQLEIILNTGPVIDSKFYNQEFVKQGAAAFGREIGLLDFNGDGHPEIVGENRNFILNVWDIFNEEEMW